MSIKLYVNLISVTAVFPVVQRVDGLLVHFKLMCFQQIDKLAVSRTVWRLQNRFPTPGAEFMLSFEKRKKEFRTNIVTLFIIKLQKLKGNNFFLMSFN